MVYITCLPWRNCGEGEPIAALRKNLMKKRVKILILWGVILLICVGLASLLIIRCFETTSQNIAANSILVIQPYKYGKTWVFDDPRTGLVREPFVAGIPEMIDKLTSDIPDANSGFQLTFSAIPFPGHEEKLIWRRSDGVGNWYYSQKYDMEGWLCPAMYKYFKKAPKELYIKADPK
jgi:hypothetical protein